jgi:hypothetical protein
VRTATAFTCIFNIAARSFLKDQESNYRKINQQALGSRDGSMRFVSPQSADRNRTGAQARNLCRRQANAYSAAFSLLRSGTIENRGFDSHSLRQPHDFVRQASISTILRLSRFWMKSSLRFALAAQKCCLSELILFYNRGLQVDADCRSLYECLHHEDTGGGDVAIFDQTKRAVGQ